MTGDAPKPISPQRLNEPLAIPVLERSSSAFSWLVGAFVLLAAWSLWGERSRSRPTELSRTTMPQVLEANRATRNELMQIPGVGPSLADKIVAHRHLNGRFRDWAALSEVPGVGEVTLEKLKAHLYFDSESPVEEMPESLEPAQLSRKSEPKVHVTLKPNLSGLIDVNSASELELQSLPGIGPVLSKRIIEERQRRPFGSIEELKRVNGIGVKKSEAIRHLIKFGP